MNCIMKSLCIAFVIVTLSCLVLGQNDTNASLPANQTNTGAQPVEFGIRSNDDTGNVNGNQGNQEIDAFTTPSTLPTTTMPSLAPATTPPEILRTTIPTEKVIGFIPTVPPKIFIKNTQMATNPPTKPPGQTGKDKDKDKDKDKGKGGPNNGLERADDDDENVISKQATTGGASHLQQGCVLLAMSLTLQIILNCWT